MTRLWCDPSCTPTGCPRTTSQWIRRSWGTMWRPDSRWTLETIDGTQNTLTYERRELHLYLWSDCSGWLIDPFRLQGFSQVVEGTLSSILYHYNLYWFLQHLYLTVTFLKLLPWLRSQFSLFQQSLSSHSVPCLPILFVQYSSHLSFISLPIHPPSNPLPLLPYPYQYLNTSFLFCSILLCLFHTSYQLGALHRVMAMAHVS